MEQWGRYITSVIAAALICGVVLGFLQSAATKELIKLICGLFLAFAILEPVLNFKLSDLTAVMDVYGDEARKLTQQGLNMAAESKAEIIKAETEAYIHNKAASLHATVEAEVVLSEEEPLVPVSVRITGDISPYCKGLLAAFLEEEFGITKENQQWIG